MSNEATVVVAKDTDVFLLLICASEKLDCFLLPVCMAIDSNQLIKIKMICGNLVSEISDFIQELHGTTSCDTTSYKTNFEIVHVFKNVYNDSSRS